jgi:uncharacterized protein
LAVKLATPYQAVHPIVKRMIDQPITLILLILIGLFTGVVSGILGIGGGVLIVPILTFWQIAVVQAIATSLVGVLLSAISGSYQNWRKGQLNLQAALGLAGFGMPTAVWGASLGAKVPGAWLAFGFAALMVLTIYLLNLKRRLAQRQAQLELPATVRSDWRLVAGIGLFSGLLSGLFGIGGGAVMVPLQMLLLNEPIKSAVRTSLGAIVLIASSGLVKHTFNGNVLWLPGICLAIGGMVGAQIGSRILPHLSDKLVNALFRLLLVLLALYMAWKGLHS